MWKVIARHEWRALVSDKTPWLVLLLLAVSIGYAIVNGAAWARTQDGIIQNALHEEAHRFDALKQQVEAIESGKQQAPFADPRAPDAVGGRLALRYVVMPSSELSSLSVGQSDILPQYFKISTAAKESVLTTSEIENPHRLLHGRFDLSFVIIYLFPLMILLLTYNLISSEREQGTLALLLSQPVTLTRFMTGKIAFRAVLLVGIIVGLSFAGLLMAGVTLAAEDSLVRLAMWTAVVAAYGAFWFCSVLLVTSFGRSSSTNALALAALWLLLVVVLPSTLNLVSTAMYPIPSRVEMIAALRTASDQAAARGSQLLSRYYEDHPELVAGTDMERARNDVAITRLAVDEEIERSVRPVVDQYDIQLDRQQRLVDRFRLLSPAIIAQDALNDVAGSGAERYRHFRSLVEDFHLQWRALFAPMILKKQRFTAAMYDELPQFKFRDEPLNAVIARCGAGLFVLLAAASVLGLVGFVRMKKYPIAG